LPGATAVIGLLLLAVCALACIVVPSGAGLPRLFLASVSDEAHPVRVLGLAGVARRCALGETGGGECGPELDLPARAIVRLDFGDDGS